MTEAATTPEQAAPPADNSDLLPVLRPLAESYGRDMLDAALRISSMTLACDALLNGTRTSKHLNGYAHMITRGLADLNNALIAAKGWHLDDLVECMREVGRLREENAPRIVRPN